MNHRDARAASDVPVCLGQMGSIVRAAPAPEVASKFVIFDSGRTIFASLLDCAICAAIFSMFCPVPVANPADIQNRCTTSGYNVDRKTHEKGHAMPTVAEAVRVLSPIERIPV
jgi:hypothetical protein